MKTTDQKLIDRFNDLISEKDLIAKTGYSREGLRKMRRLGKIKKWTSINGKKLMYSKTELAELLNLQTL